MRSGRELGAARTNRLLASMGDDDLSAMLPALEPVTLGFRQVLFEQGHPIDDVYFPLSAVVCLLTTMDDGTSVGVASIGWEGIIGVAAFLGATTVAPRQLAIVQVPGDAMKMGRAEFLAGAAPGCPLHDVVGRCIQGLLGLMGQQAACNGLHSIEERCCRWLLMANDRSGSDEFPMTHEFLAQMLGVRRSSVSLVAGELQDARLIRYRRGRVTVIDREGLEGVACECYRITRDHAELPLPEWLL